jgi:hypothetical protein
VPNGNWFNWGIQGNDPCKFTPVKAPG